MFGWDRAAAARASTRKRSLDSAESARAAGRNFRATFRWREVSSARKTSPIPPWPIFSRMR